jgi:fission process protein 1
LDFSKPQYLVLKFLNMAKNDSDKPRGPPPSGLPEPEKLPPALQKIVDKADKEDSFYDELYDGT